MGRRDRWILAMAVGWILVQNGPLWYPTPDSAAYLSIAHSLADTGTPTNGGRAQLYYSPGYPVLIAPLFFLDREPFWLIQLLHTVLAVGLLIAVYCWAKHFAPAHASWIAATTLCNVSTGNILRRPLSEIPFMLLLIVTTLMGRRFLTTRGIGLAVAIGIAVVGLVLLRPAGILLAAGIGIGLLRVWRNGESSFLRIGALGTLVMVPAVLVQLAWMRYDRRMGEAEGNPSYSQQILDSQRGLAGQLVEGLRLRIDEAGRLILPGMVKAYSGKWLNPNMLLYIPVFVAIMLGWFRLMRTSDDPLLGMFPFYLLLYIVWPYAQGTRFFTPLWPLFLLALLQHWKKVPTELAVRFAIGFGLLHLLVAIGYWLFDERPMAMKLQAQRTEVLEMMPHLPVDSSGVVSEDVGDVSLWLRFLTDRTIPSWNPQTTPPSTAQWLVQQRGIALKSGWQLIHATEHLQLIQRTRSSAGTGEGGEVPR